MPTVLRIGSARFFFYSNEAGEAPHIHVERAGAIAKFWLEPVSLESSVQFRGHELRQLERLVHRNRERFLEAWHVFFRT